MPTETKIKYFFDLNAVITIREFATTEEAIGEFDRLRVGMSTAHLYKTEGRNWYEYEYVPTNRYWEKLKRSRSFENAKRRMMDILSAHQCFRGSSEQLTNKLLLMRKDFNLPAFDWRYLHGWSDCQTENWLHYRLAFGYEINGEIFPMNWNKMPEEHRELAKAGKLPRHFYWKATDGSLTNKVWF